jgi:transposase, IS5 family
MSRYSNEAPFDASMLVHFRERISISLVIIQNRFMLIKFIGLEKTELGAKKEVL